ncbi:MAG: hypothetical protein KGK05_03100 [Xanthomonadaceae bacterium]|nr:hypothetical protein [Xanthomonadaceae bacterium]
MITSAANRGWDGDVNLVNLAGAGLPAPSVIRTAKIATIDARDAERLGKITTGTLTVVKNRLRKTLGL